MKLITGFYAKRSPSERRILAAALLIVGLAFVDRVIILPVLTSLASLNQSIREQETAVKKSMNVLLHKESILAESREYMSYSVEAQNPEEEMVALLKEIESVAVNSGLNLIYVKPGTLKEDKETKKYYSNLECEGSMEQVATFFHGLEGSTKLLKIEKYTIQPKNRDSSTARCTVSVYKTVLS